MQKSDFYTLDRSVRAKLWHEQACREKGVKVSEEYTLLPEKFYKVVEKIPKNKSYDFSFVGCFLFDPTNPRCIELYHNRKWILDFITDNFTNKSYLQFTDENSKKTLPYFGVYDHSKKRKGYLPRGSNERDFLDVDFYNILCSSQFTLCPAGDQIWSMRFIESLMCKTIPIVNTKNETFRTKTESLIDYKFYYSNDTNIKFREEWVEHNYNLFLKYHTLEHI